jgi:hypothetical protein
MIFYKKSMKSVCAAIALLCAIATLSGADAGTIKICVTLAGQSVAGAYVECFDEDTLEDDFMVDGTTGSKGCATLTYQTKATSFWNCVNGWDGCVWSNPDIYCRCPHHVSPPRRREQRTIKTKMLWQTSELSPSQPTLHSVVMSLGTVVVHLH